MSTDKTLADAQPGGRVRLGDQTERARFEAWHREKFKTSWQTGAPTRDMHNGVYADNYGPAEEQVRWEAWQAALSAQPSPGGQGDVPSIDYEDLLDQAKDLIHCGCSVNGAFEWLLEQLTDGEALAARQPVNESPMAKMAAALRGKAEAEQAAFDQRVQSCEWGPMPDARTQADFCQRCDGSGWDGESREIKCQSCAGAGIAARQPVGEPVAWLIERLRGKGYGRDKYLAMKGQASSDPDSHLFWTDQQARDNHRVTPLYEWPAQAVDLGLQLDRYDAGLLGEGGGGDVGWWQDYIRTELDRAHEFYQDQADAHG